MNTRVQKMARLSGLAQRACVDDPFHDHDDVDDDDGDGVMRYDEVRCDVM